MDYNTQDKMMYNIYTAGDYETNTAYSSGPYNGLNPTSTVIDDSDVSLEIDKDSKYTKIPSGNKKAKKIKIKLKADNTTTSGDNNKVDAVGIVFRRRAIK